MSIPDFCSYPTILYKPSYPNVLSELPCPDALPETPSLMVDPAQMKILKGLAKEIENINPEDVKRVLDAMKQITADTHMNVVILNYEDDTCKPVFKIKDELWKTIEKWYNACNYAIDVEVLDILIPKIIKDDINAIVLNAEIQSAAKSDFVNNYLPTMVEHLKTEIKLREYEASIFKRERPKLNKMGLAELIADLNIIIPTNLSKKQTKPRELCQSIMQSRRQQVSLVQNMGTFKVNSLELRGDPIPENADITAPQPPKYNMDDVTSYNLVTTVSAQGLNSSKSQLLSTDGNVDEAATELANVYCPYNTDYNILVPRFAEQSFNLYDFSSAAVKPVHLTVIFNYKCLHSLCLFDITSDELCILNEHYEYGFICLFALNTNVDRVVKFIRDEFHKIQFDCIDNLNEKLEVIAKYVDYFNERPTTDVSIEEEQVKQYMNMQFIIDKDVNNKMKASLLLDMLLNSSQFEVDKTKLNGFKHRLSKYLKKMGLEKKRYNDGFYYYGIRNRISYATEKITQSDINEMLKLRSIQTKELEKVTLNPPHQSRTKDACINTLIRP